jgi:hypothetical protein
MQFCITFHHFLYRTYSRLLHFLIFPTFIFIMSLLQIFDHFIAFYHLNDHHNHLLINIHDLNLIFSTLNKIILILPSLFDAHLLYEISFYFLLVFYIVLLYLCQVQIFIFSSLHLVSILLLSIYFLLINESLTLQLDLLVVLS